RPPRTLRRAPGRDARRERRARPRLQRRRPRRRLRALPRMTAKISLSWSAKADHPRPIGREESHAASRRTLHASACETEEAVGGAPARPMTIAGAIGGMRRSVTALRRRYAEPGGKRPLLRCYGFAPTPDSHSQLERQIPPFQALAPCEITPQMGVEFG